MASKVKFDIPSGKGRAGDVSMLSGQVTSLACLRLRVIAWIVLSAIGRIEMSESQTAIAVGWDW